MEIRVGKPTPAERQQLEVEKWSPWSCAPSTFAWEYSEEERVYIQEGRATIRHESGETEIGAGDLVTFPPGIRCTWTVHETIRQTHTLRV